MNINWVNTTYIETKLKSKSRELWDENFEIESEWKRFQGICFIIWNVDVDKFSNYKILNGQNALVYIGYTVHLLKVLAKLQHTKIIAYN